MKRMKHLFWMLCALAALLAAATLQASAAESITLNLAEGNAEIIWLEDQSQYKVVLDQFGYDADDLTYYRTDPVFTLTGGTKDTYAYGSLTCESPNDLTFHLENLVTMGKLKFCGTSDSKGDITLMVNDDTGVSAIYAEGDLDISGVNGNEILSLVTFGEDEIIKDAISSDGILEISNLGKLNINASRTPPTQGRCDGIYAWGSIYISDVDSVNINVLSTGGTGICSGNGGVFLSLLGELNIQSPLGDGIAAKSDIDIVTTSDVAIFTTDEEEMSGGRGIVSSNGNIYLSNDSIYLSQPTEFFVLSQQDALLAENSGSVSIERMESFFAVSVNGSAVAALGQGTGSGGDILITEIEDFFAYSETDPHETVTAANDLVINKVGDLLCAGPAIILFAGNELTITDVEGFYPCATESIDGSLSLPIGLLGNTISVSGVQEIDFLLANDRPVPFYYAFLAEDGISVTGFDSLNMEEAEFAARADGGNILFAGNPDSTEPVSFTVPAAKGFISGADLIFEEIDDLDITGYTCLEAVNVKFHNTKGSVIARGSSAEALQLKGGALTKTGDTAVTIRTIRPSSDDAASDPTPTYTNTVSDPANGSIELDNKKADKGDKVTISVSPDKGYRLSEVTVKDAFGNVIALTNNGDGTYTFAQPASRVTVSAVFTKAATADQFADIDPEEWYYDGIAYCVENGLMNGTSEETFAPHATTTRGQIIAMLWRMAGCPTVDDAMTFTDVDADAYYAEAIRWAASVGITSGYSAQSFGPNDAISRQQLATFLYHYEQTRGGGFTGSWMFLLDFTDRAEVSSWAYEAMCWMNMNDIIGGMGDGTLNPGGSATRAQTAAVLMRFCEND